MQKHAAVLDSIGSSKLKPVQILVEPEITVVIVSTNEGAALDACLGSVLESQLPLECIVVNNMSTDQTRDLCTGKYRDDRLIRIENRTRKSLPENSNIGLRAARGRYVLLLNPDTVVKPGTLETMVRFMDRHPESAVSTCRLIYPDGSSQDHVRRFPTPWTYFCRISGIDKVLPDYRPVKRYLMHDMDRSKTQEVDWFILAFYFIRKSAVDRVGLLEERFFKPYYGEDIEWCYRAKLMGFRNYYVANAMIIHEYQQGSRKGVSRLTFVHLGNVMLLFLRHGWSMLVGRVQSV